MYSHILQQLISKPQVNSPDSSHWNTWYRNGCLHTLRSLIQFLLFLIRPDVCFSSYTQGRSDPKNWHAAKQHKQISINYAELLTPRSSVCVFLGRFIDSPLCGLHTAWGDLVFLHFLHLLIGIIQNHAELILQNVCSYVWVFLFICTVCVYSWLSTAPLAPCDAH